MGKIMKIDIFLCLLSALLQFCVSNCTVSDSQEYKVVAHQKKKKRKSPSGFLKKQKIYKKQNGYTKRIKNDPNKFIYITYYIPCP